jgi:hypothetical protein
LGIHAQGWNVNLSCGGEQLSAQGGAAVPGKGAAGLIDQTNELMALACGQQ